MRRWDDRGGLLLGALTGLATTYVANQLSGQPRLPGWMRVAAGVLLLALITADLIVFFILGQRRSEVPVGQYGELAGEPPEVFYMTSVKALLVILNAVHRAERLKRRCLVVCMSVTAAGAALVALALLGGWS